MRLGSLRDPEVARDAKVTAALGILVLFLLAVPEGLGPVLGVLGVSAALLAMVMHLRGGPAVSRGNVERPHRGPNVSRIPMAGLPGFVFVVGFVFMFWAGVPQFHGLVIGMATLGVIGGVCLIAVRRRRQPERPASLELHLGTRSNDEANDGR